MPAFTLGSANVMGMDRVDSCVSYLLYYIIYFQGDILNSTDGMSEGVGKPEFVCKPCATNITVIYNPLKKFIKEIENATIAAPG